MDIPGVDRGYGERVGTGRVLILPNQDGRLADV